MTVTSTELISPTLIGALRRELTGTVLTTDQPGFDSARAAWNLNAQHRPVLVVLPETTQDIRRAVRFAAQEGVGVGVLATGHGTGSPCDGGVLINTSRMRSVEVDGETRRARVGAGALWEDVVGPAAARGLAGLAGSSPRVGVVGYSLGGGFGWLGRRYGLAAHSITGAELVTAAGEVLTVGPDQHPDVFWGLQGGTGNLGIVSQLDFTLHPVREVYAGNLYYPLARARDVLTFFAQFSRSVPSELTAAVTFRRFPPLPTVDASLRGQSLVALRGCCCGDVTDGRALIDQARAALGPAAVDTFAVIPTVEMAAISLDPVQPLGAANHVELLRDLTPAAIEALVELAGPDADSPLVMVEVRQLGGALPGPSGALSPMAHTTAKFSLNAIGVTADRAQEARVRCHLRRLGQAMRPHATGDTYVNFLDLEGACEARVRAAYSDRDWARLLRLKAAYDPDNLFRFNRNIWSGTPDAATTKGNLR